jgi:hypothetical protein
LKKKFLYKKINKTFHNKKFKKNNFFYSKKSKKMATCEPITVNSSFIARVSATGSLNITNISSDPFYQVGQDVNLYFTVENTATNPDSKTLYDVNNILPVVKIGSTVVSEISETTSLTNVTSSQLYSMLYTTTSSDVTAGLINFTIDASGLITIPGTSTGQTVSAVQQPFTLNYTPITITASCTPSSTTFTSANQTITLTYAIDGDGTVDLPVGAVSVLGTGFFSFDNAPTVTKNLGFPQSFTLVGSYTTTTNDVSRPGVNFTFVPAFDINITNGEVTNTVHIEGSTVTTPLTYLLVAPPPLHTISIALATTPPRYSTIGDFPVSFTITNTGNVSLILNSDCVALSDGSGLVSGILVPTSLSAASQITIPVTFSITQQDIDNARLPLTVVVTSPSYTSNTTNLPVLNNAFSSTDIVLLASITRTIDPSELGLPIFPLAGQVYSFVVRATNTGNATALISPTSTTLGVSFSSTTASSVAPGDTVEFIGSYIPTSTNDQPIDYGFRADIPCESNA